MDSIDYYNKYANVYYENTINLNMEKILEQFIELVPEGSNILDLGCGSGRDSLYFIEKGYDVTALDGSKELCELAEIHIGQDVLNMTFKEMDFDDVFDGIWACASLLHIVPDQIDDILNKISKSLKEDGILYLSVKYGNFKGIKNERYFCYYKTNDIKELFSRHRELEIIDIFKSEDIRKERTEDWLNVFVRKIKTSN